MIVVKPRFDATLAGLLVGSQVPGSLLRKRAPTSIEFLVAQDMALPSLRNLAFSCRCDIALSKLLLCFPIATLTCGSRGTRVLLSQSPAGAAVSSKRSSRVSTRFYEMKDSRNNDPRPTPLLCGSPVRFRPQGKQRPRNLHVAKAWVKYLQVPDQQAYFWRGRRDLASRCRGGGV
jgi:hypothetical protein